MVSDVHLLLRTVRGSVNHARFRCFSKSLGNVQRQAKATETMVEANLLAERCQPCDTVEPSYVHAKHDYCSGLPRSQVQDIAPRYFPQVDKEKILFISNRVSLENNMSSDRKVLLKGAQSRNVSSPLIFIIRKGPNTSVLIGTAPP